jgi:hypothetical protein
VTAGSGRIGITAVGLSGRTGKHGRFQSSAMIESPTVEELKKRWEKVLAATDTAVARHPDVYREIKLLAGDILTKPLDIKDYPMTADKLVCLLKTIGCETQGSIFHFYHDRVTPLSISHLKLFRVECQDLLAHLYAYDKWRRNIRRLRIL